LCCRLLIKNAVMLSAAKEGEVTVVQVETEGYNKAKVVVPIVAMKAGRDLQTYVDVLLPGRAKLSLLQGEGPIQLVGSHCVDFGGYGDAGDDSEEDDEADEEKIDDEETEELAEDAAKKKTPIKSVTEEGDKKMSPQDQAKRKASQDLTNSQEKKAKASPAK
jgi:hypothetical protein